MRAALWIVGEPGLGKTTLARALLPDLKVSESVSYCVKPKVTFGGGWLAAGHYVGNTFDGADTVGYSGVKDWLAFWRDFMVPKHPELEVTLFDGDRFSYEAALEFVRATGVLCYCAHVTGAPGVGAARRAARGSHQNEAWLRGRTTKSAGFAQLPFDAVVGLDAALTTEQQAGLLRSTLGLLSGADE